MPARNKSNRPGKTNLNEDGGSARAAALTDEVPRVIVFDLDGTLWDPEMYQLRGGAPFKPHKTNPSIAIDRCGEEIHLIGESRELLQMLATDPKWANTHLAVSSTCDYPAYARELLNLFTFTDASGAVVTMHSLFGDLQEIYYANKASHHRTLLQKIRRLDPSVTDFSQFLFFDNQTNNIRNVSAIGVPCCYCFNGMTKGVFEEGLRIWQENQAKL